MDCSGLVFPIHPPIKVAMAGPAPWPAFSLQPSLARPVKSLQGGARGAGGSGAEQEHSTRPPGAESSLRHRESVNTGTSPALGTQKEEWRRCCSRPRVVGAKQLNNRINALYKALNSGTHGAPEDMVVGEGEAGDDLSGEGPSLKERYK